jgi:uncharacterized membrane protein YdjX (TVP38/TMEM64 family)
MDRHKDKRRLYLNPVLAMGGLAAVFIIYKSSGILDNMTSMEALRGYIQGFGKNAYIVFFLIQLLSVILAPVPSHISTLVGAAIFGMWASFIISWAAIAAGSVIVFILARKLGKPFIDKIISARISGRYKGLITPGRGETVLALLLFLPFFPDDALCFLAGISGVKLGRFLLIMLITRPWGILAASALGSSRMPLEWWALGTAVLIIFFILNKRYELKETLFGIINKIGSTTGTEKTMNGPWRRRFHH